MSRRLFLTLGLVLIASPLFAQPRCGSKDCFLSNPRGCFGCIFDGTPDVGCTLRGCHQCDSTCTNAGASTKGASQYLACASTVPEFMNAMSESKSGLRLWRVRTPDAPAVLEAVFQNPGPILTGRIVNLGKAPIVSYRIGWLKATWDGNHMVVMGKRISTTPIKPLTSKQIRPQGPRATSLTSDVRGLAFFVAEVRFANGRLWKAEPDSPVGKQTAANWKADFTSHLR
jgi:hypothetical protein